MTMQRPQPKEGKSLVASYSPGIRISGAREFFSGMFIDIGLNAELDQAAQQVGWPSGKLPHSGGRIGEHYLIPSPAKCYALISGVPYKTVGALANAPADCQATGLACRWPQGERSAMAVHLLFDDLIACGFTTPIPLVVRSTHTDDLLAALLKHNAVIDRIEAALKRSFAFWEIAIPLAAGDQVDRPSRADAEKSSPVEPIICAHPDQLTPRYVKEITAPAEVLAAADEWREEIRRYVVNFVERSSDFPAQRR